MGSHSTVFGAWVEYLAEVVLDPSGPSDAVAAAGLPSGTTSAGGGPAAPAVTPVTGLISQSGSSSGRERGTASDADLIDQLRALEELKAAAAAAQARIAAAFDVSQRRLQVQAGVRPENLGRGVAAQVALARKESPNKGGRLLGFAKALTTEMPYTLQALTLGKINEWRATLLVRETACLSAEDRRRVDEEVAGDLVLLESLGDGQIIARTKAAAYRLDPQAAVNRAAKAVSERFVSCRPAPDTMTYLTGLLPVAQGVGVYAALCREADRLRAAGDTRGRGQIMADTLVQRVTGQADANQMKVEIQLVMTDRTLLSGDSEPALIPGYGPVPAQWARNLVRERARAMGRNRGPDRSRRRDRDREPARNGDRDNHQTPRSGTSGKQAERWIRRLYTAPESGELVAMDSHARLFPTSLARFIATRDQTCRTPWCGAPIRHLDHIQPHRRGGPTSADNGQGLCEACNHAKEAPGWSARTRGPTADGPTAVTGTGTGTDLQRTVETTTPTGHTYRSTAPPLPGKSASVRVPGLVEDLPGIDGTIEDRTVKDRTAEDSPAEACLVDLIWAA